jgi:alkylation response protein AidB-like acyl-CoA dehydrogenase
VERLREEVRVFVAEHAPRLPFKMGVRSPETPEQQQEMREWSAALFKAGWLGHDWPVAYGGTGVWDPVRDMLVGEELARRNAPEPPPCNALLSDALLHFGNDEQKTHWLPRIRSCEDVWCQLFSEPGAGSDLAGMRTSAVLDGDHYVVNGQKVWTTNAHWADMGYLLARTDPSVPKHRGISALMLDMRSPGVVVKPLRKITGGTDFNEVFLEDVRVPAENLIGEPGQGWQIATASLATERATAGASVVALRQAWEWLWARLSQARGGRAPLIDEGDVRHRMVELLARIEALDAATQMGVERYVDGHTRVVDAPFTKLFFGETYVAVAYAALELIGPAALVERGEDGAVDDGLWPDFFLYCRAYTVAGGSSEIMRNIIAERGLGLPR